MDKVDIKKENEAESNYFSTPPRSNPNLEIGSMKVETDFKTIPPGLVIPTLDAVGFNHPEVDIRPRLVDNVGQARLIDSGAQISATPKRPGDVEDLSINLVAVNGSRIKTFGVRDIVFNINRKQYKQQAVVCEVSQDILGMDFVKKYKLGFEWDDYDQSELFLVDKRAQIKKRLQIVTVPKSLQRAHHFEAVEEACVDWSKRNTTTAFEISCVKSLAEPEKKKVSQEEALKKHAPEYVEFIKAHPELLEPSFRKGKPVHNVWHRIETGEASPCKSKRRPIIANSEKAEKGRAAWEQMIKDGVVEEVSPEMNTEWSSALHLVDKEGGGVRPCSDFRALNAKTVTDAHPLPLLRDFTGKIHGAKLFSKVDLRSAFFNILIWPAHRHKTLTLSPWGGSYVYNRLAFGLSSGPSSWQKLLEHVLKEAKDFCFIYLDDILVWGRTKAEHDANLKKVFKLLAANQMALSVEKCEFGKPTVDYLGYKVTTTGITPLPAKLQALRDFRQPLSQKDVLHFCGALNYFRSSLRGIKRDGKIKSAAAVLQPLYAIGTDKLPSKAEFEQIWQRSPALKVAFEEAKEMLMNAVELHHPNTNYPLALFTDASDYSIGGSLQMLAPDGHYKPLGFYSAHLSETQKKYSVFKKELLGAHKSLRHFLPEIYGKHVVIYTDHLPLQQSFQSNSI